MSKNSISGICVCGTGLGTFIIAPVEQWTLEHLGWRSSLVLLAGPYSPVTQDSKPVFNYKNYRDSVTRFSTSGFFHESVSPKLLKYVVDPRGKFATSGAPWLANISANFEKIKKFEMVLMGYSVAGGKLIHEKKTRSKKSRDTVPLRFFSKVWKNLEASSKNCKKETTAW